MINQNILNLIKDEDPASLFLRKKLRLLTESERENTSLANDIKQETLLVRKMLGLPVFEKSELNVSNYISHSSVSRLDVGIYLSNKYYVIIEEVRSLLFELGFNLTFPQNNTFCLLPIIQISYRVMHDGEEDFFFIIADRDIPFERTKFYFRSTTLKNDLVLEFFRFLADLNPKMNKLLSFNIEICSHSYGRHR